jgi:hypothetical protein
MKRRHFLALLGFFSLLGANAFWRPLRPSWGAEATEEHLTRSVAALADVMFPGDGLPKASARNKPYVAPASGKGWSPNSAVITTVRASAGDIRDGPSCQSA